MSYEFLNPRMAEYYRLSGYAFGVSQNHIDATGGFIPNAMMFGGMAALPAAGKGASWLWKNKADYSKGWEELKNARALRIQEAKDLKGKNIFETIKNRKGNAKLKEFGSKYAEFKPMDYGEFSQLSKKAQIKANNKVIKSNYYKEVRELIEKAKGTKGKELKEYLSKIDEAIAKANLEVHNAKAAGIIKPATRRGKVWNGVKKYSGYSKVSRGTAKLAASSKTFRTVSKGLKGNAGFALLSLAFEAPEIYETYKTCGSERGNRQLGKSLAVVGAEVGGYALGAAGGAAIGAALGTAICPVIGTAIGALCGLATSALAGWVTKKVIGAEKSELEKHKEEQAQEAALKASKDPKAKKELLEKAGEKLQNADASDEEALNALKSYEKLINQSEKENTIKTRQEENKTELINLLEGLGKFGTYSY